MNMILQYFTNQI